jgi:hypothetical protein
MQGLSDRNWPLTMPASIRHAAMAWVKPDSLPQKQVSQNPCKYRLGIIHDACPAGTYQFDGLVPGNKSYQRRSNANILMAAIAPGPSTKAGDMIRSGTKPRPRKATPTPKVAYWKVCRLIAFGRFLTRML